MADGTEEATGPTWETGPINLDSIKQVLHTLANAFPFVDENSKNAMHSQIDSLHEAGDPNATPEEKAVTDSADKDAEIARLQAELAAAKAGNQ